MLKRVLLAIFIVISFPFTGSRAQNLVVRLQDGSDQTIPLSQLQKITFSGNDMVFCYATGSLQAYSLGTVEKLFFSNVSGLQKVQEPQLSFYVTKDGQLHIASLSENGSLVELFRTDGIRLKTVLVRSGESIDVSGFPRGLYLIRIDQHSTKFVRP